MKTTQVTGAIVQIQIGSARTEFGVQRSYLKAIQHWEANYALLLTHFKIFWIIELFTHIDINKIWVVIFLVLGCAFAQRGGSPQAQVGKAIQILKQLFTLGADGTYDWSYDAENGISASEQGAPKQIGNEVGNTVRGYYTYPSPNGEVVKIEYVSDENGFQPSGNVLPTPHPIPDYILRALAYNAAHPEEDEYKPKPGKRF
ncbi:hypothetical protein FQR65_LT11008 [Abscondita terminalis]|nr:hypothetical protein FQR65_LT11008 [Abscondita terminalis]